MADPWFEKYNSSYLKVPGQFDWGYYGVVVEMREGAAVEAIGGHHLDQSENCGKHHIYGDILGQDGKRVRGAIVAHRRVGSETIHMVHADKPDDEPAFNIPMWAGEVVEVWIESAPGVGPLSDHIRGLRTDHPDEPPGNTWGHHSFWVSWRVAGEDKPPAVPVLPPSGAPDVAEALLALQDALNDIKVARRLLGADAASAERGAGEQESPSL